MENRRVARFDVTYDLIARLLHMPESAHILKITDDPNKFKVFTVTVEHEELPMVALSEGAEVPQVTPWITDNGDGTYTWDWSRDGAQN